MALYRFKVGPAEPGPCLVCGRHVAAVVGLRYVANEGAKVVEAIAHPSCARVKTTPPAGAKGPGDLET